MAIVFEEQRKPINWIPLLFTVFIVGFIGFAAYYLFFAPTPRIDAIFSDSTTPISDIDIVDAGVVLNDPIFSALKLYVGTPAPGALGRQNPFSPL